MKGNTKRSFKKEYIPLLIAILVLVVLVLILVIVLFYKDDKGLIVPDLPDKEAIDVGVFDFNSGKYSKDELDVEDTKKVSVDYKVITDYYKNGILISNPTVKYEDNEFIVRSGKFANDPFISIVDDKGKIKWLSKINVSRYETLKIIDVIKKNGYYNVFAVGVENNKNDNIIIRIDSKGNEEKREIISSKSNNTIKKILSVDKGFVIMTDGQDNIEIYYVSDEYKMLKNPFYLKDSKENKFKTYNPTILSALVSDEVITMIVSYVGVDENTNYLVKYDLNKGTLRIDPFIELNKISFSYSNPIESTKDNFYTINNNIAYLFSTSGKLINKYDYNSVKLPEIKNCEIDEEVGSTCDDSVWIGKYFMDSNNNFLVESETSSDNMIFDVFDKELKLVKRYSHYVKAHGTEDAIYISSFYVNDKLYEFYSFGIDTPSILVSIIG